MRLLADENVSGLVVTRLRSLSFDVLAIGETRAGASDREVIAIARSEDRILITEDRDFGEMIIRQRLAVRGLVLLELDRLSNTAEADLAAAAIVTHSAKLSGSLVVVEPGRVRIRPLPQKVGRTG
jgi:predicted nuclease of predicted toxin-antitoxin system